MLQAVSARRGMRRMVVSCLTPCRPNATGHHHRHYTDPLPHPSRDVVLIDAPGHAEFLRNMITAPRRPTARC